MTTRSKRRMLLGTGVAAAITLVLVLLSSALSKRPRQKAGPIKVHEPARDQYTVRTKITSEGKEIVRVDRSVQFTFKGDTKVSPGSLLDMTAKMRQAELDIATALHRNIEIP
jgi:hypothetical protein